jgi:hypothetical protein
VPPFLQFLLFFFTENGIHGRLVPCIRSGYENAIGERIGSKKPGSRTNVVLWHHEDIIGIGIMSICPGCHLELPDRDLDPPDRFSASGECFQLFSDLSCYTVSKRDAEFINQHAVDAYEAQHAGDRTKNITVVFGLIGLYLALEKGFTGRQVQATHMKLARIRKDWPRLDPPAISAPITVFNVLQGRTDEERDHLIREWMESVWNSWNDRKDWVCSTTDSLLFGTRK